MSMKKIMIETSARVTSTSWSITDPILRSYPERVVQNEVLQIA